MEFLLVTSGLVVIVIIGIIKIMALGRHSRNKE